jgi:septal ring factor EnvC (AmiA/AmiB activator)
VKRRRQDFHEHKSRRPEESQLDLVQLRDRTTMSLERLGRQRLSAEVGGYSLENWVKNLSLLLNDFEEKLKPATLPSEYAEKKRELESLLTSTVSSGAIDGEVERLRNEVAEASKRIADERERINSGIDKLTKEQVRIAAEIKEEKTRLTRLREEAQSRPLYKRILGRDSPEPTAPMESKIRDLEAKLASLPAEITKLQTASQAIARNRASPDAPYGELWSRLETSESKLKAKETEKVELMQLTRERERLAAAFAELISRSVPTPSSKESAPAPP